MKMNIHNRILFFTQLISCSHKIGYWCYYPDLNLLNADTTEDSIYDSLFSASGCKDYLRQNLSHNTKPIVMSDSTGLMWIAASEHYQEQIARVHVIGPVFIADVSVQFLEKQLSEKGYSIPAKRAFLNTLRSLPVLSLATCFQYGQMLHYTVNEEKLPISDFLFQLPVSGFQSKNNLPVQLHSAKESHGTWAAEQNLIRMVEEGNLNYQEAFDKIVITGSSGISLLGDPIRQAKNYGISFVTLCSRAAMRAGLSPELTYTLSDYYLQGLESSAAIPEIQEICHLMYKDYITRVHDLKQNSHISRQIQESCHYIQIHSAEKLTIAEIAEQVGYTEYYFSKKFKQEMGITIKEYIKMSKLNVPKSC